MSWWGSLEVKHVFKSIRCPTKDLCICCILVGVESFSTDLTGPSGAEIASSFWRAIPGLQNMFFLMGLAGGRCFVWWFHIQKARLLRVCPNPDICTQIGVCFLFPTRITVRAEPADQRIS